MVKMGTEDPCPVSFHILVPLNLTTCPYLAFTPRGVHNHPPPNKPKEEILDLLAGGRWIHQGTNKAVFHRYIELLGLEDIKERLVLIRRCDELRAQLEEQENVAAFIHKRDSLANLDTTDLDVTASYFNNYTETRYTLLSSAFCPASATGIQVLPTFSSGHLLWECMFSPICT